MPELKERVAALEQWKKDHEAWAKEFDNKNDKAHHDLLMMSRESLKWQRRLRWTFGVISSVAGIIIFILYKYAPWIWDALPKHGHTH